MRFVLKKLFKTSEQLCNMFLKRVAANVKSVYEVVAIEKRQLQLTTKKDSDLKLNA